MIILFALITYVHAQCNGCTNLPNSDCYPSAGVCDPVTNSCVYTPVNNGTACTSLTGACYGGTCYPGDRGVLFYDADVFPDYYSFESDVDYSYFQFIFFNAAPLWAGWLQYSYDQHPVYTGLSPNWFTGLTMKVYASIPNPPISFSLYFRDTAQYGPAVSITSIKSLAANTWDTFLIPMSMLNPNNLVFNKLRMDVTTNSYNGRIDDLWFVGPSPCSVNCSIAPSPCMTATGVCDYTNGQCQYTPKAENSACVSTSGYNGFCRSSQCLDCGSACNTPTNDCYETPGVCQSSNLQCTYTRSANNKTCQLNGTPAAYCQNGQCVPNCGGPCNSPPGQCYQTSGACQLDSTCGYSPKNDYVNCTLSNVLSAYCLRGSCLADCGSCNPPNTDCYETNSTCDTTTGVCQHYRKRNGASCVLSSYNYAICQDGQCVPDCGGCTTTDQCYESEGICASNVTCIFTAKSDGTTCTLPSIPNATCQKGVCTVDCGTCNTPPNAECYDTNGVCQSNGQCGYTKKVDNSSCIIPRVNNAYCSNGLCLADCGVCQAPNTQCYESNSTCDTNTGICMHYMKSNGVSCVLAGANNAICQNGQCVPDCGVCSTSDQCYESVGVCTAAATCDFTAKTDGTVCTLPGVPKASCQKGVCTVDCGECTTPPNSVCYELRGVCQANGECAYTQKADNTTCVLQGVNSAYCQRGVCVADCGDCTDSGNQCDEKNGVCEATGVCRYTRKADNTSCVLANIASAVCKNGNCVADCGGACVTQEQCYQRDGECQLDGTCRFTKLANNTVCELAGVPAAYCQEGQCVPNCGSCNSPPNRDCYEAVGSCQANGECAYTQKADNTTCILQGVDKAFCQKGICVADCGVCEQSANSCLETSGSCQSDGVCAYSRKQDNSSCTIAGTTYRGLCQSGECVPDCGGTCQTEQLCYEGKGVCQANGTCVFTPVVDRTTCQLVGVNASAYCRNGQCVRDCGNCTNPPNSLCYSTEGVCDQIKGCVYTNRNGQKCVLPHNTTMNAVCQDDVCVGDCGGPCIPAEPDCNYGTCHANGTCEFSKIANNTPCRNDTGFCQNGVCALGCTLNCVTSQDCYERVGQCRQDVIFYCEYFPTDGAPCAGGNGTCAKHECVLNAATSSIPQMVVSLFVVFVVSLLI